MNSKQEQREANAEAAGVLLANEFVNAMRAPDLNKVTVSTPGFPKPTMTMVDVVGDLFSGTGGDAALAELLSIVATAARNGATTARAQAWIAARAKEHATFHADDMATIIES